MTLSLLTLVLLVLFAVGVVLSVINKEFRTGVWWFWLVITLVLLLSRWPGS